MTCESLSCCLDRESVQVSTDEAASPADIAPTLASLTGIALSQTNGRVLAEAIVPPSR